MIEKILSDSSALFLFWLFASAGIGKLKPANRRYYADLMSEYLGSWASKLGGVIMLVGGVELLSGLALLAPTTRMLGAIAILALLVSYLALMSYQLYQGKVEMDCGCSGPYSNIKVGPEILVRNVVLCIIAALCFLPAVAAFSSTIALASALAIFFAFTYLSAEKAISNLQKIKLLKAN
ncbi:MauE/DoxX family redox-associated membrane protein [Vibrio galatheae]|uniref:MauE/DoxX family redox-associated membrane protein n=1 Tax=Vibrio galatheae TaxID=579748 RepID=UPI000696C831|nr:MauE/DoxX family redox-associated membrane protein [Vibrio galatheae]